MSYEPRGKMVDLMAAVRAAPERVFSIKELCEVLHCKPYRSTVDQYIYAAIADGAMFKREINGAMHYAGSVVSDELLTKNGIAVPSGGPGRLIPTGERSPEEVQAARSDIRAPGPSGFVPKPMVAPRPARELPRATAAPAARLKPGDLDPIRTKPPLPAPEVVDADVQTSAQSETDVEKLSEEDDEQVEFNAALWLDGDIVIYGAIETEDGGILITKDRLAKLKRLIAWSALP